MGHQNWYIGWAVATTGWDSHFLGVFFVFLPLSIFLSCLVSVFHTR